MTWKDRLFGGGFGLISAGAAGLAVGGALHVALDRAAAAAERSRALPVRFANPIAQEIDSTPHGRATVLQLGFEPEDAVPEDTRVAFRLQQGVRYLKTALRLSELRLASIGI